MRRGRGPRRFPHRAAAVLAVLAALLGVPRAAQPAAAQPGTVRANRWRRRIGRPVAVGRPRRRRPAGGRGHPGGTAARRAGRGLLGTRDRRHRLAARVLHARPERPDRGPEQHLPALAARSRAGQRRHRRPGQAARLVGSAAGHALQQLRRRRAVLGLDQPAVLRHDVADRRQRRQRGVRHREIDRPGHDHRLPGGRGRGHPELADRRGRQADQQPRQRHLLPLPGRRRDHRRDLARLAGADPQARDPHHRRNHLDGGGLRGGDLADRKARRTSPGWARPCPTA